MLNVETILLPNINKIEETCAAAIATSPDLPIVWRQVIRLWYLADGEKE